MRVLLGVQPLPEWAAELAEADVAYFVNFLVAAIIYGGYRVWRHRAATPAATLGTPAQTLGSGR